MYLPDEQPVLKSTVKKFPQLSASTEFWCCFRWLEIRNSLSEISFHCSYFVCVSCLLYSWSYHLGADHSILLTLSGIFKGFGAQTLMYSRQFYKREQISSPQSVWKFLRVYLFSSLGELPLRRKHRSCSKFLSTLFIWGLCWCFSP